MAYAVISLISWSTFKNDQPDLCCIDTIHLDSRSDQKSSQTYWRTVTFCDQNGTAKEY